MSEQPKWTPGPWRAERSREYTSHYILNDGLTITLAEEEANARLIAAAPELYEALAGLIKAWEGEMRSFFGEHAIPDFEEVPQVQIARAALAKARGEV